jgi:hypothetical protein
MEQIVNKVAESGIITLDLKEFLPSEDAIAVFDLKPFLFREMILREKDYRQALPLVSWSDYQDKYVALLCSVDAIIPMWAFMLAASSLQPVAKAVYFGSKDAFRDHLISQNISEIPLEPYAGKRIVLKGCGDVAIPASAYVAATTHLRPVAKSIMYGEPCSTVPVFKAK